MSMDNRAFENTFAPYDGKSVVGDNGKVNLKNPTKTAHTNLSLE